MPYINEGEVENFMLQDIDGSYSTFLTIVIAAVCEYIDQYCGTSFANSDSSTRYYDGSGTDELVIDPIHTISALQILNSQGDVELNLTESDDYFLYPMNSDIKNIIRLNGRKASAFPSRARAVKITTVAGYETVPGPIKIAALKLTARILEKGLRGGEVSAESLGEYNVNYKTIDEVSDSMEIKNILDMYREIRI